MKVLGARSRGLPPKGKLAGGGVIGKRRGDWELEEVKSRDGAGRVGPKEKERQHQQFLLGLWLCV